MSVKWYPNTCMLIRSLRGIFVEFYLCLGKKRKHPCCYFGWNITWVHFYVQYTKPFHLINCEDDESTLLSLTPPPLSPPILSKHNMYLSLNLLCWLVELKSLNPQNHSGYGMFWKNIKLTHNQQYQLIHEFIKKNIRRQTWIYIIKFYLLVLR